MCGCGSRQCVQGFICRLERSSKKYQKKNFFRNSVVNRWNNSLEKVVNAPSVKSFESRLYDFETCLEFENCYKPKEHQNLTKVRETDLDLETQEGTFYQKHIKYY